MNLNKFKISSLFFLLAVFFSTQVFSQPVTFPLTDTSSRQGAVIKVKLKNTTQTNYTARVMLSDSDIQTSYGGGNGHPYTLLIPGAEKEFVFTATLVSHSYKATLLATKDAQPNPSTSVFYEKNITIGAVATQEVTPSPTTYPDPTTVEPTDNVPTNPQSTYTPEITQTPQTTQSGKNQCNDGIDNNGDGKADRGGAQGLEPDPSCFSTSATTEEDDSVSSKIIPCTNKCTFSDIFRLINNVIEFFLTIILIPLFIIIIIYAGVKYILAQGNPGKVANIKSILMNIVKGIILILCAWLIVRTIMNTVLNEDYKEGGVEFLGE